MASWDFTRTRPGNFAWGHEGAKVLAAQQDRAQAEELRVLFFFGGGQWGEVEVGELLTAFSGWKMYEAGELSTMITLLSSRPRRLRSFT